MFKFWSLLNLLTASQPESAGHVDTKMPSAGWLAPKGVLRYSYWF